MIRFRDHRGFVCAIGQAGTTEFASQRGMRPRGDEESARQVLDVLLVAAAQTCVSVAGSTFHYIRLDLRWRVLWPVEVLFLISAQRVAVKASSFYDTLAV